jgi:hypothetical protein
MIVIRSGITVTAEELVPQQKPAHKKLTQSEFKPHLHNGFYLR